MTHQISAADNRRLDAAQLTVLRASLYEQLLFRRQQLRDMARSVHDVSGTAGSRDTAAHSEIRDKLAVAAPHWPILRPLWPEWTRGGTADVADVAAPSASNACPSTLRRAIAHGVSTSSPPRNERIRSLGAVRSRAWLRHRLGSGLALDLGSLCTVCGDPLGRSQRG